MVREAKKFRGRGLDDFLIQHERQGKAFGEHFPTSLRMAPLIALLNRLHEVSPGTFFKQWVMSLQVDLSISRLNTG
ncbi:MAG: hypothetical protein C5B47_05270 [Verrucomicrobia bacterium]|nr:MAG: hypothetical protein C5B47_05270 [Verrucomicrobiota bacterium]